MPDKFTARYHMGYRDHWMDGSAWAIYRRICVGVRNRTFAQMKGSQVKTEPNSTERHESDMDLVRRAQGGDPDAFAYLFSAHKTKIYSLCLRMTANTAEAEDLTQDAFLQVFRKLATFRGDSALSTWLYRVAVNTVLMHMRKKGLRAVSLDQPLDQPDGSVKREQGKLDDRLSGSVDRIALTRAMKELPAGYRTIFVLHEVKGYEHHEIASLLRCSVGNSKSQLHKAKTRMRELLRLERRETVAAANAQDLLAKASARAESLTPHPITWGSGAEAA